MPQTSGHQSDVTEMNTLLTAANGGRQVQLQNFCMKSAMVLNVMF
jgi:hypothetical protein